MLTLFVILCTIAAVYMSIRICKGNADDKKANLPIARKQPVPDNHHAVENFHRMENQKETPDRQASDSPAESTADTVTQPETGQKKQTEMLKQEPGPVKSRNTRQQKRKTAKRRNVMDLKSILTAIGSSTDESEKTITESRQANTLNPDAMQAARQNYYTDITGTENIQEGDGLSGWEKYLHDVKIFKAETDNRCYLSVKYRGIYLRNKRISAEEFTEYHEKAFEATDLILKYYGDEIRDIFSQENNHDYDYPVSENLEMWAAKPLLFSDLMHLKNFINYLLRTDKKQKWTNEFTPLCYMAFSRNTEKVYTFGELSNRILTRDILIKDAMQGIKGNTVEHLCMQVIELHTLNDEDVVITDEQRIALFQDYIRRRELDKNGWKVLAYIEHSDGNGRPYHIHTLCRKEDSV